MSNNKTDPCIIYTTFPSVSDAEVLGRQLVEGHLAACVNILPQMISVYHWENEIHRDDECVMLIKTCIGHYNSIWELTEKSHPYDTPAFFVLNPSDGNPEYFNWIRQQTEMG